jgi:Tol biopolymer transport system component
MGEVYRALDTRLDRNVAVKVLPAELALNPERRARFEREARAVSALNHPHICALYDVGRENGIDYLVLEYLEGETLADRLLRGPLPLEQALRAGAQLADALDKAHRAGIVHRDVKPGNVMLTKSGPKLLDFGVARLRKGLGGGNGDDSTPTEARPLTEEGTFLGTLQYMAPEQLEGKGVDARTDIFALGSVVYEMVTGKRAFAGGSHASLIAAILEKEPEPLTPPALERVIRRCVTKDPDERWQSAADLGVQLQWVAGEGARAAAERPQKGSFARLLPWFLAAAALLVAAWALWLRRSPDKGAREVQQFDVAYPRDVEPRPDAANGGAVLSPNGKIVAVTGVKNGVRSIFVRAIETADFFHLAEFGVNGSVFSPDSTQLAFVAANGELTAVSLADRQREVWSSAADLSGTLAWGEPGIVFGRNGALWIAPAGGGEPRALTELDTARQEVLHAGAHFVPGQRTVLFTSFTTDQGTERIEAVSIEDGARWMVVERATSPVWSPTGHLLFARDGAVLATEVDEKSVRVRGVATTVFSTGVVGRTRIGNLAMQLAANGTLLFVPNGVGAQRLVSVARDGSAVTLNFPPRVYDAPRLSPDGRRVLVGVDYSYLEAFDLERGTRSQLTTPSLSNIFCIWNRDGSRIVSRRFNAPFWVSADGSGRQGLVEGGISFDYPSAPGPDADSVLVTRILPGTAGDVYLLSLSGAFPPRSLVSTKAYEGGAQLSPDGRWLGFVSNEAGQPEVYVGRFPELDRKWQVSEGGGTQPRWSVNGREIYYRFGRVLTAVTFDGGVAEPVLGKPQVLFADDYDLGLGNTITNYDVTPDGRFLMLRREPSGSHLRMVLNWTEELKRILAESGAR